MTGVWARAGVLERAARPALLVLDVDGVLLDPRPSFYAAARETASWAAARALGRDAGASTTDRDIEAFKAVGGWNDDFDLAAGLAGALVLRELRRMPVEGTAHRSAGGLGTLLEMMEALVPREVQGRLDVAAVRERCAARYAGRSRCLEMYGIEPAAHPEVPDEGLWPLEPTLSDGQLLRASGFDLALFTGRNAAEAAVAVERLELFVPTSRRMVDDGVMLRKPAPDGLLRLAALALDEAGPLVYVGDSIDDQHAVLAYRALAATLPLPELVFVRVLGEVARMDAIEEARLKGADVVATGLDAFLRAMPARDRRDHE